MRMDNICLTMTKLLLHLKQYDSYFRLLFQVEEEKNVYDIVNEDEYSEIVRQRQDDDWIVDDGEVDLNTHTNISDNRNI